MGVVKCFTTWSTAMKVGTRVVHCGDFDAEHWVVVDPEPGELEQYPKQIGEGERVLCWLKRTNDRVWWLESDLRVIGPTLRVV
jgi:hypothetical protein